MIDKYRIPYNACISEAQQLAHHPLATSIYEVLKERYCKLEQELKECDKDERDIIGKEFTLVWSLLKKSEEYYKESFRNQSIAAKQIEL